MAPRLGRAGFWLTAALLFVAGCAVRDESTGSVASEINDPASSVPASGVPASDPAAAVPPLPLRTSGRFIVDANGKRVKLVSANWYGAESPDLVPAGLDRVAVDVMARQLRSMGFDSVRLPWSNELVRRYRQDPGMRLAQAPSAEPDPDVAIIAHRGLVGANPDLADLHPFEIFDRVVSALTNEGLLVVLDNHTSRADWCCDDWDGNGLWYREGGAVADRYSEQDWLDDWRFMASRYGTNPRVVGAELRNELRTAFDVRPTWGGGDAKRDWHAAAERGGNAVLAIAPHWLVFVDGLEWSTDLSGVWDHPVTLSVPDRVVYAPHDYSWCHPQLGITGYEGTPLSMKETLGKRWGFILRQNERYTAPVWVSEIGTCSDSPSCVDDSARGSQGAWFAGIRRYLRDADIDFAYWAVNPTQSSQQPDSRRQASNKRRRGDVESYGLLAQDWTLPSENDGAKRLLLGALMELRTPQEGPR